MVFPMLPVNITRNIPQADAAPTTSTFNMGNGGTLMGAGTPGGTDPCLVQSGSAGGWHSYSTGGSNFWFGKEDHDTCQIAMMVYGDITAVIPSAATVLSVKMDWPSFTSSYGSPPNYDIRIIEYFDGATCQSSNNHDSDSTFYANVWNFSNPVLLHDVDASSAIQNQEVTLNSNASAAIETVRTRVQMNGYVCLILWQTGVPHGGGGSNNMYKCCGGNGPDLLIEWELPTTFTMTVQLYDSTNATQLTWQGASIKVGMINGTVSDWLDCSSSCTLGPLEKSTAVRFYAQYDGHTVKIDGQNSYNRTCDDICTVKVPLSVYDTTNLVFYDSAGSASSITSFGITYSNSTATTISLGASSKAFRWLPNGTQSVTSVLSPTGLELNATTGFNVTANSQTFSFLLSTGKIEITFSLYVNDLATSLNFQEPKIKVLSINGSTTSYIDCSPSCSFRVFDDEPIGIQGQWQGSAVKVNNTNMLNMTADNGAIQAADLRMSVYSAGFEFKSIDKTLDISPASFVYTLANGTQITQTNFDNAWFGNTTLTPNEINYHGTNMNTNDTAANILNDGKYLFYLDYFEVTLRGRNADNSSAPIDSISFKVRFENATETTYSADAGGIVKFYLGNHTSLNVYAFWESLLINSTQLAVSSASNNFFIPTNLYQDDASIVFFAINGTKADNLRSFGIELQFWANHTSPQIAKFKLNSDLYNEPTNFRLNGTSYSDPALSWDWNAVTRILSLEVPFSSGYNVSIVTPYNPSWGNSTIITGLRPGIQHLFEGSLVAAVMAPYTAIIGLWAYLILAALPVIMTYLKSGSIGPTMITMIFVTFAFIGLGEVVLLPPVGMFFAYFVLAISIAATLYRLLKRDD